MRIALKIVAICLGASAVAMLVVILVHVNLLNRLWFDPSYADNLQIDLALIDGSQAGLLDEFFEQGTLSSAADFGGECQYVYLLSRVTSKSNTQQTGSWQI